MVTIQQFHFSKADFKNIPKDDRALMFLAGHGLNGLGVWMKLLRLATNHPDDGSLEFRMSSAQSQMLLRSLCGALVETWEWIKRPDSQRLIGLTYLARMEPEPVEAYAALKKHFGSSGLLHSLRNQSAFHFPHTEHVEKAFCAVAEDEDWSWYPSDTHVNSFYWSCEMVVGHAATQLTGQADSAAAFARIAGDMIIVANNLGDFLSGLLAAVVRSHVPARPEQTVALEAKGLPNARDFRLPFFTEGF